MSPVVRFGRGKTSTFSPFSCRADSLATVYERKYTTPVPAGIRAVRGTLRLPDFPEDPMPEGETYHVDPVRSIVFGHAHQGLADLDQSRAPPRPESCLCAGPVWTFYSVALPTPP